MSRAFALQERLQPLIQEPTDEALQNWIADVFGSLLQKLMVSKRMKKAIELYVKLVAKDKRTKVDALHAAASSFDFTNRQLQNSLRKMALPRGLKI